MAHLLGVPICRKPGWQLQLTRPASVMEGSAVGVRLAYRSCGSIQPVSQPVIIPPTVASTVVCLRDAWLAAESDWACKRVEEVLYSARLVMEQYVKLVADTPPTCVFDRCLCRMRG